MLQQVNYKFLSISTHYCISYRKQRYDLHRKSNDWDLHEMKHWAEMDKLAINTTILNALKAECR